MHPLWSLLKKARPIANVLMFWSHCESQPTHSCTKLNTRMPSYMQNPMPPLYKWAICHVLETFSTNQALSSINLWYVSLDWNASINFLQSNNQYFHNSFTTKSRIRATRISISTTNHQYCHIHEYMKLGVHCPKVLDLFVWL